MADHRLSHPGIYCITHIPSGLIYIGSSVNIRRRWNDHRRLLKRGIHPAKRFQIVWDTDGAQAFDIYTIERITSRLELVRREQYWLDLLDPCCPIIGFNVSGNAAGGCCSGPLSAEMRAKLSASMIGVPKSKSHRAKIGAAQIGKIIPAEARQAMAEAQRRRWEKPGAKDYLFGKRSPETRAKISVAARNRQPPSAETCAKLSAVMRGRKYAPGLYETRRLAYIGRRHTPEAIAKMKVAARLREATKRASKL
jgi:group I intron endonuclease